LLDPARQPPGGISSEIPVLSIIQAAGWPVWFLIIASFLALALIIERLISLQRKRVMPESLLEQTLAIHRNRPVSVEMVQKLEAGSPLGRVFATALRHAQSGRESMKEAMEEAGRAVAHDLERYLGALGTIAAVTPLLGLFGTVVGMIEIFGATAPSGTNPQALAHGISVALYNTALGLVVAIPALIAYRAFRTRVDGFLVEMEQQSLKLLDAIEPRRAAPVAPAVAPARR
jgi:biopolymer transport protein ExbB